MSEDLELIDTQWDVNKQLDLINILKQRINRYIVGCKFICIYHRIEYNYELIDTQWDVNLSIYKCI